MDKHSNSLRARLGGWRMALASTTALASLAGLVAPLPALAGECVDECPAPSPPPGPPGPPSPPPLPHGTDISGNFFADPNGSVVQGGIANGVSYTFGGGAGTPYSGQLLSYGNAGSGVQLQATLAPIASVLATATQSMAYGRSNSGTTLSYRVMLIADDQSAADQISALLSTSGAIAHVSGGYALTGTDYGYGSIAASTGNVDGLDANLGAAKVSNCGAYGEALTAATPGCGAGGFDLPINFMAATHFSNGDPLSFVSVITPLGQCQRRHRRLL